MLMLEKGPAQATFPIGLCQQPVAISQQFATGYTLSPFNAASQTTPYPALSRKATENEA
jgi:hypothetical protein